MNGSLGTTRRLRIRRGAVGGDPRALTPLTQESKQRVLDTFHAVITELSHANADRDGWWLSWLSSRDRLNASLLDDLELLAKVDALLADRLEAADVQVRRSAPARAAAEAAGRSGWEVRLRPADVVAWRIDSARESLRQGVDLLRFLRTGFRLLRAARRAPRSRREWSGHDVVLLTVTAPAGQGTHYSDPYFGDLSDVLREHGESPLHCLYPAGDFLAVARAARSYTQPPVITFGHVATRRDVLHSAWAAARSRVVVPARLPADVPPGLVRSALSSGRHAQAVNFLILRATARLLAANPAARVLHTYENNAWERGCDLAAQRATPPRDTAGYLHCAIVPAQPKYFADAGEPGRPSPQRIITTGPAAREVLLALGARPERTVVAGCALRDPAAHDAAPRTSPPSTLNRVLVLLEGLAEMADLLRFLARAAALLPADVRLVLRGHPARPAAQVVADAGIGDVFEISREPDLVADLLQADVVVYRSTTAALSALLLGIPLVHVQLDTLGTADPLWQTQALKHVVSDPRELGPALESCTSMGADAYDAAAREGRAYVERYFTRATESTLAPFLRPSEG